MHPALALIALSGTDAAGGCPCAQQGGGVSAAPAPQPTPKTGLWLGGALLVGVVGFFVWRAK